MNIAEICNMETYLTKMSKTFFDKAWFMSHLPEDITTIVDFGCADGSFMKFLKTNCPSYTYIGIDNNLEMQKLTEENGFKCYSSIHDFKENAFYIPETTCFVLNSVLHEIYSYCNEGILSEIYEIHPKYIAIRDMSYNPIDKTRFYLPINDYDQIINIFKEKYPEQFNEFYSIWKNKQVHEKLIVHFLLKYIYNNENWSREVHENYLSVDIDNIRNLFCKNSVFSDYNYVVDFQTYYKLPYLVNKWNSDFELSKNYELKEYVRSINTHFKMLLKG